MLAGYLIGKRKVFYGKDGHTRSTWFPEKSGRAP